MIPLDLLRSHCSLAALVDSAERYYPPRCTAETRRNVLQKLNDWVRRDIPHGAPSSIFWLCGGAGAGKSALAQSLAEHFQSRGDLAASFFFFRADVNRNDGNRLIPTLALQFLWSFQGLAPFVEDKIRQNSHALFQKTRRSQMLDLLLDPLMKLSLEEGGVQSNTFKWHPRLVVIDGLDECHDPDIQCDLIHIIASAIPQFPYPLRFLITSRPESHITNTFRHYLGEVSQYNLSDDSDVDQDIRIFVTGEFAAIHRTHPLRHHLPAQWPLRSVINLIVERSSGHFIYASTVIRYIQSPRHRPDDRLQVILGLKQPKEKGQPYYALDLLYSLIFHEVQDIALLQIHRVLGIIHLRSLKSGLFALPQWTSDRHALEALLELKPGDLVLLFDPLLSLVSLDKGDIRILHKSLFHYLLDSSRSRDLQLDLGLAHENVANFILKGKESQDTWDIASFRLFAHHCQYARLNDTLASHLRSLACDPKITFVAPLLSSLEPSLQMRLQSISYFLRAIGRQDFDPSGKCHKKYVEKEIQYLRSAVPWSQRLKSIFGKSPIPVISTPEMADLASNLNQTTAGRTLFQYIQTFVTLHQAKSKRSQRELGKYSLDKDAFQTPNIPRDTQPPSFETDHDEDETWHSFSLQSFVVETQGLESGTIVTMGMALERGESSTPISTPSEVSYDISKVSQELSDTATMTTEDFTFRTANKTFGSVGLLTSGGTKASERDRTSLVSYKTAEEPPEEVIFALRLLMKPDASQSITNDLPPDVQLPTAGTSGSYLPTDKPSDLQEKGVDSAKLAGPLMPRDISFVRNAANVNINHSRIDFRVVTNTFHCHDNVWAGLHTLHIKSEATAFHNSYERQKRVYQQMKAARGWGSQLLIASTTTPREFPLSIPRIKTRDLEEVVKDVFTWLYAGSSSNSVLWLYDEGSDGNARTSLIAQFLSNFLDERRELTASYFYMKPGDPSPEAGASGKDTMCIIPTLALQLTRRIPEVKTLIGSTASNDEFIFTLSLDEQLKKLLFDPLQGAVNAPKLPRFFVIHGLEECEDDIFQELFLQAFGNALTLFRQSSVSQKLMLLGRHTPRFRECFSVAGLKDIVAFRLLPISHDVNAA